MASMKKTESLPSLVTDEKRPRGSSRGVSGVLPDSALFDLEDRLLFAVPKKGRLHEQCVDLLERIGIKYRRKPRLDIAMCTNMPIALVFLPAADIPRYVAESHCDLGITGEDMIAETGVEVKTEVKLGFGKCRLCLQAPVASALTSGADVLGKRIVTSFPKLTKSYIEELAAKTPHSSQKVSETSITYVSGSVEVACGLGLADAIVDLVESGDTMVAHQLIDVDTLLTTQAVLLSNKHTPFPKLVAKLNLRVQGVIAAKQFRMLTYNVSRAKLAVAVRLTPGQQAPTITPLADDTWVAVQAMVKTNDIHEMMDALNEVGATAILTTEISNTRLTL
ncbi:ATP phosphoribosyltransferase [Diplonema papillatum]|nr:ATP phosphoribosyltransferase [Diplonema papillatum]